MGTNALIMSTTTSNDNLSTTLFGKTRRAVLSLIYGHSDESFYLRQLARITAGGMGAVQREIKSLVKAGIIKRIEKGRQTYYQANPECPVFAELKSLIMKTAGMSDILKISLAPLAERIRVAFIYGSIAKGDEAGSSDVDIFIIGDVTFNEVVEMLNPVQQTLNREINPSVYPFKEFKTKLAAGHHFLRSILEDEKWFLIGDENEFTKLAEQ
jgi:predicted nucleotidyltransferase